MAETLEIPQTLQDRVQALRLPDKVDMPGRSGGGWLPWAICVLLALATVSLAARVHNAPASTMRESSGPAAEHVITGPPSAAQPAVVTAGGTVLESKGYIIAAHQIQVSPIEVSGLVKELYVEEGRRLKRGDVLAVLDRTSFDADAADARGTLVSAEAKLSKLQIGFREEEKRGAKNDMEAAEADLVQTKADFSRIDELFAKGPGISVTKTDWDAARANRDRASRRYLSAQAHTT